MIAGLIWALCFCAVGVLAYAGMWNNMLRSTQMFAATATFAALYHGLGMLLMVSAPVFTRDTPGFYMLFWCGVALNGLALTGLFWLPKVLLPTWWNERAQKERERTQ